MYVKSLMVDGVEVQDPIIRHEHIVAGGEILFEMSGERQAWFSSTVGSFFDDANWKWSEPVCVDFLRFKIATPEEMGHDEL
jgi:hypothetical protein